MAIEYFDIEVPRNGSWSRNLTVLADSSTGPVDLTGSTIDMFVRNRAGDTGAAVAEATIVVLDAANGRIKATLLGSDFTAVPGVNEIVRLAYDLKVTQDGTPNILARGAIILSPGVTY